MESKEINSRSVPQELEDALYKCMGREKIKYPGDSKYNQFNYVMRYVI